MTHIHDHWAYPAEDCELPDPEPIDLGKLIFNVIFLLTFLLTAIYAVLIAGAGL